MRGTSGGLAERLAAILGTYPQIAAAYLFGSTARGDARADSDVDIGVVLRQRGGTGLDHYRMLADLASRLESVVPGRAVDLVLLEPQGPTFCLKVLVEGKRVYEADRNRRVDFESETMIRAYDEAPTRRMEDRVRRRRVLSWLGIGP